MSKDFAFPQFFISAILRNPQSTTEASPFTLNRKLLGDLATLFNRESMRFHPKDPERARLEKISKELDRMWRVKTASVRGRER